VQVSKKIKSNEELKIEMGFDNFMQMHSAALPAVGSGTPNFASQVMYPMSFGTRVLSMGV